MAIGVDEIIVETPWDEGLERARETIASVRTAVTEFYAPYGHGIGMNVHERPFLSAEDETPLEAG